MDARDPSAIRFKRAVSAGDANELRRLFAQHPELSEVIDEPWFSFDTPALVHAAGCRDRVLVDALIDLGADVDARSAWSAGPYSALHRLVDGADEESLALADHIAGRGAQIDLHAAAGMGRADIVKQILDAEPDRVSEAGPDGATPLHLAKNMEIAALLLDHGAEIDKRCIDHESTAAMWAVQGREPVMRFLIDNGARTDLFMAVLLDDIGLAQELLEGEPEAIDVRVRFGESHEHLGLGDKYVWALDGADTPVELARQRNKTEVYDFLLERSSRAVQLVQASRRGDSAALRELLSADPHLLSNLEDHIVCEALYGSAVGARTLIARGADPKVRDDQAGATALHHASWRGLRELAEVLLDGGADPSLRDRLYSATPLGWAHEGKQDDLMALLIERHPPDIVDAAWLGDAERVKAILAEERSLVDGLGEGEVSPLRSAAWCGKADVVRVLLEHGADPVIPHPKTGKTALDLATEQGHDEVVRLLS